MATTPLVAPSIGRSALRRVEVQAILAAARVPDAVEPQRVWPWEIDRLDDPGAEYLAAVGLPPTGWPTYTLLRRLDAGCSQVRALGGETVMEDSRRELSRHLPIWLAAEGRVLVTGLGLGCVVRGLLASPRVEHVDVVEVDPWIFDTIGPEFYDGNKRVRLWHADALTWTPPAGAHFDFAWHDLWCEEGLQVQHVELLLRCRQWCDRQGAWALPRFMKRAMSAAVGVIG